MAYSYKQPDGSWSMDLRGPPVEVAGALPDNITIENSTTTKEKPKRKERKERKRKVKP
jgi:hypothetical protein